jgi:hypothetical protein
VKQDQPLSMSWCLDCHRDPAPNIRDPGDITNMAWQSDENRSGQQAIAKNGKDPANHRELHPPLNCSGCHR